MLITKEYSKLRPEVIQIDTEKEPKNGKTASDILEEILITMPAFQFKQMIQDKGFNQKTFIENFNISFLVHDFKWSTTTVQVIPAKVAGQSVSAIVDTESTRVVIYGGCVCCLQLQPDAKVDISLSAVTTKSCSPLQIFYLLQITVRKKEFNISAIVIEGLHFNLLLGVNWND